MKKANQRHVQHRTFPPKKNGITKPTTRATKVLVSQNDKSRPENQYKGTSTYREDYKDFSATDLQDYTMLQRFTNTNTNQGTKLALPPSSPLTTTFRRNFKGEPGPPAKSCCPKWFPPDPARTLGSTGYSVDYRSKPLPKQRSPPPTKMGNNLHTYPSNVLLPYTRPEQVITIWKPFAILPPVDGVKSSDLLAALSKGSLSSTYRDDYLAIR